MKVILIKDVPKLGRRFDIKEVSSGHALNLLIPQGLVVTATPDAIKRFDVEKKKVEGERAVHEELLVKNIKGLDGVELHISGKANEKGHLFAGLHREEIAKEIEKQTQLQVDPSFIQLEHPLKVVGEHSIVVKGGGKEAKFTVVVERVS
ncbi:MAG: 50S ribosomal protein L9 [Candidatus Taylorbacteria bacterium]